MIPDIKSRLFNNSYSLWIDVKIDKINYLYVYLKICKDYNKLED